MQNFVSAAVGIAVAVALVRGFARRDRGTIGNFWVDLIRGTFRLLLPLVDRRGDRADRRRRRSRTSTASPRSRRSPAARRRCPGGPVASQEAIKELGTNGGGFFNANSAHPFENPTPWTSLFEILLLLAIPFALPRAFGKIVGDNRQGYAILARHGGALPRLASRPSRALELRGRGHRARSSRAARWRARSSASASSARPSSPASTTLTSTGAVNSMHDSYTALGGMMPMLNMMLGEVAPGGVGSGLYGMLVLAVIAVFVGGPARRPHARVPRQEDRAARDQAREPLHPRRRRRSCSPAPR